MRVLITGCGYVGLALGTELARQGHQVIGLRRSPNPDEFKAAGIEPCQIDITRREELNRLPCPFDWVVNLVSSAKGGGVPEYRQAYLEGTRNLLDALQPLPPKKFIYTSSTGVYGHTDGSQVKEEGPTEPASETAQVLVETERLLRDASARTQFPAVILRVAGIYGPDRGYHLQQFLKNEATIPGRGDRYVNMIHRDDLVGILTACLKSARPGEVYNAVDDEPVQLVHLYRWLAETLGKWMPPFVPEAAEESRKRGLTNKKVLNRKLKMQLGYPFKYPTFRQGYTAEIQRLDRAGLLNIEPEPR
jgi:nucleoside-diphosphate-sugar epimerase